MCVHFAFVVKGTSELEINIQAHFFYLLSLNVVCLSARCISVVFVLLVCRSSFLLMI